MITHELKPYLQRVGIILNSHQVEYMIVGGAAVSHYGFNRPSGIGQYKPEFAVDLDFWYNPTKTKQAATCLLTSCPACFLRQFSKDDSSYTNEFFLCEEFSVTV
jgi:hypothetical protein